MKYVLSPLEIAKEFSLYEALHWIAFKTYAIEHYCEDFEEKFEENRCFFPSDNYYFVLNPESKLESLPGYSDDYSEPSFCDWMLSKVPMNEEQKIEWQQKKEEGIVLHSQYLKHVDIYDKFLDLAKAELFLALTNGKVKAVGDLNTKSRLKENVEPWLWDEADSWEERSIWDEVIAQEDFTILDNGNKMANLDLCRKIINDSKQEIPEDFWREKGIAWERNEGRSPIGEFTNIHINTDDLFKVFPEEKESLLHVEVRGGTILFTDNIGFQEASNLSKRGRKPKYDWGGFNAEIARYILENNGIPKLQKILENYMLEWCQNAWENEPTLSAVRMAIQPYYSSAIPKIKETEFA